MEGVAYLGISREFLPVPGDTLAEALEERSMSQKELALRLGRTETYVSQIVNGRKRISARMARSLEDVLGIVAEFWVNLQAAYDAAVERLNAEDGIDEEEKTVLSELHEGGVDTYMSRSNLIPDCGGPEEDAILAIRRLLGVSALTDLRSVARQGAFRLGAADAKPSVMGAWILLAERLTSSEPIHDFEAERMPELMERLREELSRNADDLKTRLTDLFREYGITFAVIPHFRGAPVQGYIAPNGSKGYRLVVTIRGCRADCFWFTLFHELGHIANGDIGPSGSLVDSDTSADSEIERRADAFARGTLIDDEDYADFERSGDFSDHAIAAFAKAQNVPAWIAKGRLQRDGHVSWSNQEGILHYQWAK